MTYEQYWCGDPLMVRAFYKAEKIRQMQMDNQAWLTGLYVKNALESTVCNMLSGKTAEKAKYPSQPFMYEQKEKEHDDAEREKQEAAQAKLYMYNMVRAGKEWGNN